MRKKHEPLAKFAPLADGLETVVVLAAVVLEVDAEYSAAHLSALAAFDEGRMQEAQSYCDRRVDRSRDPSHDLRALDVVDDALLHLRKR